MTTIYDKNVAANLSAIDINQLRAPVWVLANVDGTSNDSFNVSSLTDVGTGDIGVNFSLPFASADYVAIATAVKNAGGRAIQQTTSNLSASRSDFLLYNGSNVLADPTRWNISIVGNMAI